jgi:WbqC-like protein family
VRAGIIQSNYIPWKGYFDFIDAVDVFILLDDVQYTRRDWRNRNRIKTNNGPKWLSIPVEAKGKYLQRIDETHVAGSAWVDEHMNALRHSYRSAPHFHKEWPWIQAIYEACRAEDLLTRINERFIRAICDRLDIRTPIHRSTEFDLTTGKNERLIHLCGQIGATEYLSGPAARDYMRLDEWQAQGINVLYKSYDGFPQYEQPFPPFEDGVTILDLLFCTGPEAGRYFRSPVPVCQ